ncbi:MAG: PH domain-containing protein [Alphaproteobacteria bacterium]|nr:PH domain-containing protein [Alphaproteobacteria bacterium]
MSEPLSSAVGRSLAELPTADTLVEQELDPRVVTLWRLSRLIRVALVGLPLGAGIGVGLSMVSSPTVGVVAGGLFVAFRLTMAMLWPALMYRHFRYSVREHDLLVQSGVLFRRWSSVPHSRIQHVDTRQGPLERMLGLSRLAVYTAAGMSADGSIPGLAAEEAERLRDALSRRGGDDGV